MYVSFSCDNVLKAVQFSLVRKFKYLKYHDKKSKHYIKMLDKKYFI